MAPPPRGRAPARAPSVSRSIASQPVPRHHHQALASGAQEPPQARNKKPKKRRRPRRHRAYGLPNANQIFLTLVVVALLFIQLLRPNWLVFSHSDATAGLSGLRLESSANDTTSRVSWRAFCDPDDYNFTLPIDETVLPALTQPFATRDEAQRACASNTPETVRALTATAIAFAMLSTTVSLYFHLGAPSQRQVEWLGVVPGGALLATGALGTAALAVWQENFGPYDNGDCFSVATSSTVIAYVVAISMAIRWRWPGIFAVDDEQQAFEVRRNWRRRPRPTAQAAADDAQSASASTESPRAANDNAFHAVV